MKSIRAIAAASFMGLVSMARPCLAADSATVKLRDGTVVTGKVQGELVLKDVPLVHRSRTAEIHLVRYAIVSGGDVLAVDERGIQLDNATLAVVVAAQSGTPPADDEVLRAYARVGARLGLWTTELNEHGVVAGNAVGLQLRGLGSPGAGGASTSVLGSLKPLFAGRPEQARPALRLACAQPELWEQRLRAAPKEGGKHVFILPDAILGERWIAVDEQNVAKTSLRRVIRVAESSRLVELALEELQPSPPRALPDALGGVDADIVLARRLDAFLGSDVEVNADSFTMSIVKTKKDEPPFDHVVVGEIRAEGMELPPDAAQAFETALLGQVSRRGFKGVSSASAAPPAAGSRVLEMSALVIPRVTRPVIALRGIDRGSGQVVYAMAIPLYQLGHKGVVAKQLAEATIHFARYIKPRL